MQPRKPTKASKPRVPKVQKNSNKKPTKASTLPRLLKQQQVLLAKLQQLQNLIETSEKTPEPTTNDADAVSTPEPGSEKQE